MKKRTLILLLVVVMMLGLTVPVLAEIVVIPDEEWYWTDGETSVSEPVEPGCRVVDHADLLNIADEVALRTRLDEISQRQQLDVVVVTVNYLGTKSPMEYADDFFDDNGYGFGANRDGILLLISMAERDWWISTSGYGITAFTDAGLEYIGNQIVPKLGKGQYAKAFGIFAQECDAFINQARTGEPYDVYNLPKEPFRFGMCLFVSVLIGLFTAGCVLWGLKGQLASVHAQPGARYYSVSATPDLTTNKETYLYSTMSSRPRPKVEEYTGKSRMGGGFSGGSTIHRSSSGRSHGGRGGKF